VIFGFCDFVLYLYTRERGKTLFFGCFVALKLKLSSVLRSASSHVELWVSVQIIVVIFGFTGEKTGSLRTRVEKRIPLLRAGM